jgi:hypothetical protein
MDQIRNDIEEIREMGISLGLDDVEIDTALYECLKSLVTSSDKLSKKATKAPPLKKQSRSSWPCVKCICLGIVLPILLLIIYCVVSVHLSNEQGIQTSVSYQLARVVRFLALPLLKIYDLSGRGLIRLTLFCTVAVE